MVLQYLLLYRERLAPDQAMGAQSVWDNVNALSEEQAALVYSYMDRGATLWEFISPTLDPLTNRWDVPNVVKTDGEFVWDGVLMRWVQALRVRLPQVFINRVERNRDYLTNTPVFNRDELVQALKIAHIVRML
jgi:hypothetical protein